MSKTTAITENTLGPAMSALNERQRAFVDAMFSLGAQGTYLQAARLAGYAAESEGYLRVQAHRLAHNEKVQAAIREEGERMMTCLLPAANVALADVVKNPSHPDHMKAVKHAQALAGLVPSQKVEVIHKTDTASLRANLMAAMDLLKSVAGPMIDVTPEPQTAIEYQPEEDWIAS